MLYRHMEGGEGAEKRGTVIRECRPPLHAVIERTDGYLCVKKKKGLENARSYSRASPILQPWLGGRQRRLARCWH